MSCNYAEGLSPYHDKGQLGLEEKFDCKYVVASKVSLLTKWIKEAKHVVVHTGAGISTSAGIPDFRGPRGVWTLQEKGEKPDMSKDFNEAIPTVTHMAIMKLVEKQKVKYVVSQNIDGLHLRSNLQRKYLSELHGNMFTEQCNSCNRQFVRSSPVPTVGQKSLSKPCPATKANGRPCRGRLHDTILDWEHNLPENDLGMADYHSCMADLSICLGTTMQIVPSGNLPLYTKRHGGKLVIVNLQPTKHDKKANLIIHTYVDDVMSLLMKNLGLKIPKYSAKNDPTRTLCMLSEKFVEWTISDSVLKKMKRVYEEKCGSKEAKKRLEMIYDDIPLSVAAKNMKRKIKEDEDSDLEVLDVIVKPKKSRETSRRSSKKNQSQAYQQTITIKKVVTPSPSKKFKYDGEKITIKKNVTPTKTKYEIVTKPKKVPKCEIVYCTDGDLCNDLDMICESDDDEMTNNFTYNFRMYLHTEDKKSVKTETVTQCQEDAKVPVTDDIKEEKEKIEKKEVQEVESAEIVFNEKEDVTNPEDATVDKTVEIKLESTNGSEEAKLETTQVPSVATGLDDKEVKIEEETNEMQNKAEKCEETTQATTCDEVISNTEEQEIATKVVNETESTEDDVDTQQTTENRECSENQKEATIDGNSTKPETSQPKTTETTKSNESTESKADAVPDIQTGTEEQPKEEVTNAVEMQDATAINFEKPETVEIDLIQKVAEESESTVEPKKPEAFFQEEETLNTTNCSDDSKMSIAEEKEKAEVEVETSAEKTYPNPDTEVECNKSNSNGRDDQMNDGTNEDSIDLRSADNPQNLDDTSNNL